MTNRRNSTTTRALLLTVFLALFAAACGSGASDDTTVTGSSPSSTPDPTPVTSVTESTGAPPADSEPGTTAPVATIVATDIGDVSPAVVQIVAQGTFVDPQEGLVLNAAGAGSGFFIDPSGLVVTNNHVVTGAATLEVFVEGESHNARLVASSECHDLAVIQVVGQDFPALGWFEGAADVGLDVYAAGFPLGDPEFTLTRGIVSKAESIGETSWASIDAVLEHDANINPRNSGGPLVTESGEVVGVNYAGRRDTDQFFAIAGSEARPVIDRLVAGEAVDWIGINGQAVVGNDISGVWVAAVESGSPASRAGIQAGDLITRMEGLVLATDGTMADYCDVLRTRQDQAIALEVVRSSTSEVLTGEINGAPLSSSFSFAEELSDTEMAEPSATGSYTYVTVTDDTGLLSVDLPAEWRDVNGRPSDENTLLLEAAVDLGEYGQFFDVPGTQFTVSIDEALLGVATDQVLGALDTWRSSCDSNGVSGYDDGVYVGHWESYTSCGGSTAGAILVVARPADAAYTIVLAIQVVSEADLEAADRILNSFLVTVP